MSVRSTTKDEWLEVARADAGATAFHTPMWASALAEGLPGCEVATVAVEGPYGLAIWPAVWMRDGKYRQLLSMYNGVYGGPICVSPLTPAQRADITQQATEYLGANSEVVSNPFRRPSEMNDGTSRKTHVIDLTKGHEAIWRSYDSDVRRRIRRARERSLRVIAVHGMAGVAAYYSIYEDALARWGASSSNRYPRTLFESLMRIPGSFARMWLVKQRDQLVGGWLALCWNGRIHFWHGACLQETFKHGAVQFSFDALIHEACSRGERWLDLGSNPGLEGVGKMKRDFGTIALIYRTKIYQVSTARRLKRRLRELLLR